MAELAAKRRVFVVGVGMTKFEKPGRREWDYPDMARIAASRALTDAKLAYDEVEQACVGYCYGDSTCGQRAVYELGMTGIPVYNVNNNCATGSTALYMAQQFVRGGLSDCVLALGFEKMERGSLGIKFPDRTNPLDKHVEVMMEVGELAAAPGAPLLFGNAGREHMKKYGTKKEHFAKIAVKNHKHSKNNPYSQFRDEYSLEEIMAAKEIFDPLTKLQCCPTSDGAAAAIVVSEAFVVRHGLQGQAVEIVGQGMASDPASTLKEGSMMKVVGYDMSRRAATAALRAAGISARDVQVAELHDCFSCNEMITYEAIGLCAPGEGPAFVDAGDNTYGGRVVVNPSGGLISKGHPLGATGLAQCAEMCWQLRGEAGPRQVAGARYALSHNLGLGGACVVTVYHRPDDWLHLPMKRDVSGAMGFERGAAAGGAAPAAAPVAAGGSEPAAAVLFRELGVQLAKNPDVVSRVRGVFQWVITGSPGGKFVVDLKTPPGDVRPGTVAKPDVTITVSDDNFVGLMSGKLNAQKLFMSGKLRMKGKMALAMKLGELTKLQSKL